MIPNSRGSAGLVAVAVAAVILLGCAWLAFGPSPRAGRSETIAPPPRGADAAALARQADDLLRRLSSVEGVTVPGDLRFSRDRGAGPSRPEPPAVRNLRGAIDGDAILLRWDADGAPASGFLVERIAEDGQSLRTERLPSAPLTFRDEALDSVAGSRTYRVTALGPDGLPAGYEQRAVKYRIDVVLAYLGAAPDGHARFTVSAASHPPAEFAVAPGAEIGEVQPGMDWRTGFSFSGLRATRQVATREVDVPVFRADGTVARQAETGAVLTEKRAVPVPVVSEGAVVLPPDTPDVERWLPRSKN